MDEQGGEAIIKKTQEEGMKIGTKYQIISDSTNVTLQERGYNKTKKEHYWTNIGYFGNPRNALRFLVERKQPCAKSTGR